MTATAPDSSMKEDGFDLGVTLTNTGSQELTDLEVQVAGKAMSALACQSVTPPEEYSDSGRASRTGQESRVSAPGRRAK